MCLIQKEFRRVEAQTVNYWFSSFPPVWGPAGTDKAAEWTCVTASTQTPTDFKLPHFHFSVIEKHQNKVKEQILTLQLVSCVVGRLFDLIGDGLHIVLCF